MVKLCLGDGNYHLCLVFSVECVQKASHLSSLPLRVLISADAIVGYISISPNFLQLLLTLEGLGQIVGRS